MRTAFVTDPSHVAHESPGHPERPERLEAIVAQLEARGLRQRMLELTPREATDAELLRVHRLSLLDAVARAAERGAWLDPDTYTTAESIGIARRAAGSVPVPHLSSVVCPRGPGLRRRRATGVRDRSAGAASCR